MRRRSMDNSCVGAMVEEVLTVVGSAIDAERSKKAVAS